jgi:hypothetical protein
MNLKKLIAVVVLSVAAGVASATTGPDFSGLTSQVDWTTAIAAILLVMGGIASVYIVMKGGSLILSKLRG